MRTAAEKITKPVREPAYRKPNQTREAVRRRELIRSLIRDLGHQPTTAELALVEQAGGLITMYEAMQLASQRGEPVAASEITKISGLITRILGVLRPKSSKRGRPSTPSLSDYLARKATEKAAGASDGDPE